jgi:hypothetical protein
MSKDKIDKAIDNAVRRRGLLVKQGDKKTSLAAMKRIARGMGNRNARFIGLGLEEWPSN